MRCSASSHRSSWKLWAENDPDPKGSYRESGLPKRWAALLRDYGIVFMKVKSQLRFAAFAAAAFAADRITKSLITAAPIKHNVPVIKGVVSLSYVRNSGAAFSLFAGSQLPLIIVTALIMIGVAGYVLFGPKENTPTVIGSWLIIGGGIGNLYDRIAYGSVIDFIRLDFIRFAIFNTADIFVCVGCGLVILGMLFNEHKERKNSAV